MPEEAKDEALADLLSIDGWTVDVHAHQMTKGGEPVKLEPRTMAVLVYLAARPNQAVPREELEREVWHGLVVGYDALSNAIAKLRKAFADNPRTPNVIETIPKVGYRLIAPVEIVEAAPGIATIDRTFERKLAAILYADVAGYSRLTGQDEDGTHRDLRTRLDQVTASVNHYNGRVVHFAGDAVLADFPTASDAVTCALAVQHAIAEQDADVPIERRVQFRIGVNLGEVIVDRDDIYGDGVNIAARLEALARPGGVCLSGAVYDAIGHSLPVETESLGEQIVKNIAKPVRAYHAQLRAGAQLPDPTAGARIRAPSTHRSIAAYTMAAMVLVVAVIVIVAATKLHPGVALTPRPESPTTLTASTTAIVDLPTVAVLPFENLSHDAGQMFFADGITSTLIADLSKISGLAVTGRHSVFTLPSEKTSFGEIGAELGVHYIVHGSVQRAGGRLRIIAQLVDATSGVHVWGDRFDRPEADIFALQDEVIAGIVSALSVRLTNIEQSLVARRRTNNLEAYDLYLRAEQRRLNTNESSEIGNYSAQDPLPLYREALKLDPQFTDAYAGIARTAVAIWQWDQTDIMPSATARRLAYESASKLLALDENDPRAYAVLGIIQVIDGEHDQAINSAKRALALAPNDADSHANFAEILTVSGRHAEARSALKRAFQLNPRAPADYYLKLGAVLFFQHDYEAALQALRKATDKRVNSARLRVATYAKLDRLAEAAADLEALYHATPFANLAYYRTTYAHYRRKEDLELYLGALAKAGIPAWAFGYEPHRDDILDAESLGTLTVGRTWSGHDWRGGGFIQQFTKDGRVAFRGRTSLQTGTARVHRGMLCVTFPAAMLGREDCGYVYRNPNGSANAHNQYVRVALGQIYYFSVSN
jgi:TolB-like protein/class 3 adenylate cyclase/cytochrome c-type biogenesis protein CcmH/NrfG